MSFEEYSIRNTRVEETPAPNNMITVISLATGIDEEKDSLFSISDDHTSKNTGVVDYLGISDITSPATNAIFTLNGAERTAFSNTFTVSL